MTQSTNSWLCLNCGHTQPLAPGTAPVATSPAAAPAAVESPAPPPPSPPVPAPEIATAVPAPQTFISAKPVPKKPQLALIAAISGVALLVIGGGAWATVQYLQPKPVANCAPLQATTLDSATLHTAFTNFVVALKAGDQACIDQLASADLTREVLLSRPAVKDGRWVVARSQIAPAWNVRVASLPAVLDATKFTQAPYTPAAKLNNEPTNSAKLGVTSGVAVQYPIKYNDADMSLSLSFIISGGVVLADQILIDSRSTSAATPTATPTPAPSPGKSAKPPTPSLKTVTVALPAAAGPAAALSADTITLAEANIRTIWSSLQAYNGNTSYYPDNIAYSTLSSYSTAADAFVAPAGTAFIYKPAPSGCTTAAHTCQSFTLDAVNGGNKVSFYTKTSAD